MFLYLGYIPHYLTKIQDKNYNLHVWSLTKVTYCMFLGDQTKATHFQHHFGHKYEGICTAR